MRKGTKIALLVTGVLVLGCLVGVFWMFKDANQALYKAKEESIVEGNEILVLAGSQWNYDDVALRTSAEFLPEAEARPQFQAWSDEFGPLVTGEMSYVGFRISEKDFKDTTLVVKLQGKVTFEKGKGDVRMTLTRKPRNSWELAELSVTSAP